MRVKSSADLLTMSKLNNIDAIHFHNEQHNLPRAAQIIVADDN